MSGTGEARPAEHPYAPVRANSTGVKPRGILKNAASSKPAASLLWDEENLAVNELAKDSTMKIDEPKTPWVNYDPTTDTVMDLDKIPGFELGKAEEVANGNDYVTPPSPSRSQSSGDGTNSRRGSGASEKMVKVETPGGPSSGEDDDDDELQDDETREHRKKFAEMRGGHYRNEAEAMKRAQALLEEEESSGGDSNTPNGVPPLPSFPHTNGVPPLPSFPHTNGI